jgi:hypothetical protein
MVKIVKNALTALFYRYHGIDYAAGRTRFGWGNPHAPFSFDQI